MEEACPSKRKQSTVVDARRIQTMRCRSCHFVPEETPELPWRGTNRAGSRSTLPMRMEQH